MEQCLQMNPFDLEDLDNAVKGLLRDNGYNIC